MTPAPAITPALPLHAAGPYVAAAYLVFLAVVLVYVAIMAIRLTRNQRELMQLRHELEERTFRAAMGESLPGEGRTSLDSAALPLDTGSDEQL